MPEGLRFGLRSSDRNIRLLYPMATMKVEYYVLVTKDLLKFYPPIKVLYHSVKEKKHTVIITVKLWLK